MQKFDNLFKSKNIFFIAIVIFSLSSFTLYHNRDDIFKLFKSENKNLSQPLNKPEESKTDIKETKEEAPLLSTKTLLSYVSSLKFPEALPPVDQKLKSVPKEYPVDYTADTSKARSQISGEPAERTIVHEQRQVPKFDIQLNSESFRQDELKDEPAEHSKLREQRRMSKNLLVSSDRDDAIPNLEVSKVYIHYLLNVNLLVYNFLQDEDYSKELQVLKSLPLPQDIKNILANLEEYNNNYLISKSHRLEVIFPTNHKWLEKFIKIEKKPSDSIPKEQDKLFILEKLKYLINFLYSEKFMQEFINKDV